MQSCVARLAAEPCHRVAVLHVCAQSPLSLLLRYCGEPTSVCCATPAGQVPLSRQSFWTHSRHTLWQSPSLETGISFPSGSIRFHVSGQGLASSQLSHIVSQTSAVSLARAMVPVTWRDQTMSRTSCSTRQSEIGSVSPSTVCPHPFLSEHCDSRILQCMLPSFERPETVPSISCCFN